MQTREHPLQSCCTPQLTEVISLIAGAIQPEKIFLLGVQRGKQQLDSIYACAYHGNDAVTQYHLLVLHDNDTHKSADALQDKIETACRNATPVITWVLPAAVFTEGLQKRQRFAAYAVRNGLLCYDAGNININYSLCSPAPAAANQKENRQWFNRAAVFLADAELYCLRKQFKLAAFLLHQCTGQIYVGWLLSVTGYRAPTHSLDRLHQYVLLFNPEPANIFPRHTPKEEELFRLLKSAYTDPGYSDSYPIRERDIMELLGRLRQLLNAAEKACIGKIIKTMVGSIKRELPL
jgi:HEPN domain-containing protein